MFVLVRGNRSNGHSFKCLNGNSVDISFKCDGITDCPELGEDEDPHVCHRK